MEQVTRKLFAIIVMIVMLFVSYILGNRLMTYASTLDTTTQWVMYTAIILTIIVGTFGVPLLIAVTNLDINPFNAIFGFGWLMFATPFVMSFMGFVWDLATQLLNTSAAVPGTAMEGGTPLLIIQLIILGLVVTFAYIIPLGIMISEEPLPARLMGGA